MERIKKFFIYFIIFIAIYLFVDLFTNISMKEKYDDINNYQININSPKITIMEGKRTYSHGYIKGNILNDTGEHIKDKYLQFDFYNENGAYLGTESEEIKYFNVGETINFDINYEYNNVNKIKISFVDEVIKPEKNTFNIFDVEDETLKIALPIGIILGLYAILP